jgi:hypothetical protein
MIDKTEDEKSEAPRRPVIRYLDRPDCLETFADSITAGIRRHPRRRAPRKPTAKLKAGSQLVRAALTCCMRLISIAASGCSTRQQTG